jgi:allantoate deiminase
VKTETIHLAERVIARCRALAEFSEDAGSIRRTFLSPPMRDVHRTLREWLAPFGAQVRVDAAGNFRAVIPGLDASAPRLLLGSHLDTVPNAGAFDGILGVVLPIAILESLAGERLPFAIEIIGFSEEEGVRFGTPFIGSRALVGRVDETFLNRKDPEGISVREAIEAFGLNPSEIGSAQLRSDVMCYLEFHIEQGPVLESLGLPLAAVDAIAGQSRWEITFVGRANHAGTTPMNLRHDAVAGTAEWITAVEDIAKNSEGLVATVGSVQTKPGAGNVIAGEARSTLDVRHRDDAARCHAVESLMLRANEIARRRELSVRTNELLNQSAVAMNPALTLQIEDAIQQAGCTPHRMASGAGHDAMILAEKIPTAMIFLRTPGGISHDPAESVSVEDVAKAIECGVHLLRRIASTSISSTRTSRA